MADFAPPQGPPPPQLPDGWKAVWNPQYEQWFYVNLQTKASQWDKPTESAYGVGIASDTPPGYASHTPMSTGPEKYGSNNPFSAPANPTMAAGTTGEDERLARQLQEEEEARARGSTQGAAGGYYGQQSQPPYQQDQYGSAQLPEKKKKGGLFGKIQAKLEGAAASRPPQGMHGVYPQQHGYAGGPGYGQPVYGPGGYGQPGYGHGPAYGGGHYGGSHPPRRAGGGGMGMAGGAALGLGAGVLGGALIANGMDDAYEEGYEDGGGGDDDGGGDDGGE